MKTLYRYTDPNEGVKVRLIKRETFIPPATHGLTGSNETSYTVVVDVPGEFAMFDNFHSIDYAASAFATVVERFGGVTQAGQLEALP